MRKGLRTVKQCLIFILNMTVCQFVEDGPLEPLRAKSHILNTNSCSQRSRAKQFLNKRIPILTWIKDYNMEFGIQDLIAGITLGLTIIPESIACALLAGLPARYGLCSAFLGILSVSFFRSRFIKSF